MENYLTSAIEATKIGGEILRKFYRRVKEIEFKGEIDLVTEVDKFSEQAIVDLLSSRFPRHSILAEEGTVTENDSEFKWIIDPLDGTTNYTHGYPVFCISIALEKSQEIILGVVYQPMSDELFVAEKGGGAFRNGRRIQVSKVSKLKRSLIVTGFAPSIVKEPTQALRIFSNFLGNVQSVRRDGAAALDLCHVAMGHFDGFWEINLNPWDTAAGILMTMEAGGLVTDFSSESYSIYQPQMLASNKLIHEDMRQIIVKNQ